MTNFADLLQKQRAIIAAAAQMQQVKTMQEVVPLPPPEEAPEEVFKTPAGIVLDSTQAKFVRLLFEHKGRGPHEPIILVGPAGSGKSTVVAAALEAILAHESMHPVQWNHKHLPAASFGVIVCSYTRRATANVRKRLAEAIQGNCITIHKTLEFGPEFFEILDPKTKEVRPTMRFIPSRTNANRLPQGLKYIIIDEYSMLSAELYGLLAAALPPDCMVVMVGDIYQIPPVMGTSAIAPYLCVSPTVELTKVYRTALDNPIIDYATRIRKGEPFKVDEPQVFESASGKLTLRPWKNPTDEVRANGQIAKLFQELYKTGQYDPEEDQILMPWDVRVGCIELNKAIGTMLAKAHERYVWEIITGYEKIYLSVGDTCVYDMQDCKVVDIKRNVRFLGKMPRKPSLTLDYYGTEHDKMLALEKTSENVLDHVERLLAAGAIVEEGNKVNQASHIVTVQLLDSGEEVVLSAVGEFSKLRLAYAMTIHKAQGSEWRRVFIMFHALHNSTMCRELLYTAFTRAKQELYVVCDKDTFVRSVHKQAIKGNTLEEKAKTLRQKAKFTPTQVT